MIGEMLNLLEFGTFYIEVIFYARVDEYNYVYKLLEDKPVVYIFSHLVTCIKVLVSQYRSCTDLYTISVDVYEYIYQHHAMEFVVPRDQIFL